MRTLLLGLMLVLASCGVSEKERRILIANSEDVCKCQGGVFKLRVFWDFEARARVQCMNGGKFLIRLGDYVPKRSCNYGGKL